MRWYLSRAAAIGMRAAKPFKPMGMADIVSVFDYATLQIRVMQQKVFNKQRGALGSHLIHVVRQWIIERCWTRKHCRKRGATETH